MPKTITQVNTADTYTDQGGANINSAYQSKGGWCTMPAQVMAQIQHSSAPDQAQGQEQWSDEFVLPAGAHYLQPGIIGIRFRSFTAGNPVAVSAAIFYRDEQAIQLGGSGISSPSTSVASLNFQHNDVAVATEPTADFEDGANVLTWSVVDDPANTRVKITPSFPSTVLFPGTVEIGNSDVQINRVAAGVVQIGVNGAGGRWASQQTAAGNLSFSAIVDGDITSRFYILANGTLNWGPGNAAVDVVLSRKSANNLQITGAALWIDNGLVVDNLNSGNSLYFGSALDTVFQRIAVGALQLTNQLSVNTNTHNGPGTLTTADRIFSGVVGTGGIWVDGGSAQFFGSVGAGLMGMFNGGFWLVLDNSGNLTMQGTYGFKAGSGTGGAVTQLSGKSTAVTLNKITGRITMSNSALVSNGTVTFALNNTFLGGNASAVLTAHVVTGQTTGGSYQVWCETLAGTGFISVRNQTGGSLSEAIQIQFYIMLGANS